jgi:predicted phage replisome organizer
MKDGSAPWIKVVTRIFEDPKIIAIEELPEGSGLIILWFKLLTLAGEQNRGGAVYFTEAIPFTAELLAAKWRCKPALVQMALGVFQKFGMIGIDQEGTIWILNWSKYQNEEGLARIRDRSLLQLEDRSTERSVRIREQAAARQRKRRQEQKQHGSNGAVTRHALRSVTVTPCHAPRHAAVTHVTRDTREQIVTPVTQQTEIETKNKNLPPTVPPRGTGTNGHRELSHEELKSWMNTLFGRQRPWSYEEEHLLSESAPIAKEDRALLSWAYTQPRDTEGWVLIDGKRASKPKQSLILLLREFSSEIDKWRSVRNGQKRKASESEDWTDKPMTSEQVTAAKKLYGDDVPLPAKWSQLAPSVRDEIMEAIAEKAAV